MTSDWNVRTLLAAMAQRGSTAALMHVRGGAIFANSCEDLVRRTCAAAGRLRMAGLASGEPVGVLGPNSFELVIARLALGILGAVAIPVDEFASDEEIRGLLTQFGSRRLICPSARATAIGRSHSVLRIEALDDICNGLSPAADLSSLPAVRPEDAAIYALTSGTTGTPKAVVLTNSNIGANVASLAAFNVVRPGDRVLLPLPLHHVYPFVVGLLVPLTNGATVLFPESATGPQLLEAMRLTQARAMLGVPRLYTALCAGVTANVRSAGIVRSGIFAGALNLSAFVRRKVGLNPGRLLFRRLHARFGGRLELLVSGGARLDAETLWMLAALGFEIRSGYGLAETASIFTANAPRNEKWGSEGKPLQGQMRIVEPDDKGTGAIQLKGPQVFSRYLDSPDGTAAAFTADGWFRTGDLGRVDRDGFLYVAGRANETLVLGGGKKIDPDSLEKIYGTSRYIREIAVLERHGALVALVVPAFEAIRAGGAVHIDTAITIDLASCARNLPSWQRVSGFAIAREPLPRTRFGKYRRFLLPAIYERALQPQPAAQSSPLTAEDEELLQNPVARQVYDLLRRRYPRAPRGLDTSPLLKLGIDSLEWIAFGLELEDRLKLRLSEADIGSIVTLRDLLTKAVAAAKAPASAPAMDIDWTAPTGVFSGLLGALIFATNRFGIRALFGLRVVGRLPDFRRGPCLIVANHASYMDASVIASALPYRALRRCYWAGDANLLFSRRWQKPFTRAMHIYPLDERAPLHAIAMSQSLLERGDSVVWFPEGWRSPDGTMQPFLPGIGRLLKQCPVPVVPLYIDGTFEAFPRGRVIPSLRPIRLVIGDVIAPSEWSGLADGANADRKIAAFLRNSVERLGPPQPEPASLPVAN